jgi:AcrR family transcriptional regulator
VKPTRRPPKPVGAEAPAPGTRERVLQVARQMIASRGNAAISLVELAAEAGLSRQTLYLLFGSRAGLLLAMVDHMDESSAAPATLAGLRQNLPATEAFEPYVRGWFEYLPVVLPVARALSAAATSGDADARSAWDSRMRLLRGGFLQLTRGLRAADRLREGWTPEAAADWMFTLTHVDTWQHLVVDGGWKPAVAIDRIVANLRDTLVTPER